MKASRQITSIFSILLVACLSGSVLLLRGLDRIRSRAPLEEVLYIPSPKALKRLSLGYDGLLADIYWTRAVQYFGNKHNIGAEHFDLLAPLLEITTALDPRLIVAYEYGTNFLAPTPPNGAGMPNRAIKLDEFGIRNNPDEWRLYYDLGFVYYTELHDYARAADAFARGSRVPHAHPFLRVLAGQMAEHAGNLQTARAMWSLTYDTAQDKLVRANAAAHLRALQVDEDVPALEAAIARYRQKVGRLPSSFAALMRSGWMRNIPVDPLGNPYKLMPDGRVELRNPDDFPFIRKGTPPGYMPPRMPKLLPSD
jgi:tetratricopeptide (TPR) repeat protein